MKITVKEITFTAMFLALNIALSSFGIPVPGGHFYLNDVVIGVSVGALIMIVGYSLGRAFVYSTPEYAILKLPYQILQAVIGAAAGVILCYPAGLKKAYRRTTDAQ